MPATESLTLRSSHSSAGATRPILGMVGICVSSLLGTGTAHADGVPLGQAPVDDANKANGGSDLQEVTVSGSVRCSMTSCRRTSKTRRNQ
jgi:hypothetical protein